MDVRCYAEDVVCTSSVAWTKSTFDFGLSQRFAIDIDSVFGYRLSTEVSCIAIVSEILTVSIFNVKTAVRISKRRHYSRVLHSARKNYSHAFRKIALPVCV
jgi:hypothetical protein